MVVDRNGRVHYPAGTPRSRGGEFAPTGAAGWVVRASRQIQLGDISPGLSTSRRRPAPARRRTPGNRHHALPRVGEGLARGSWGISHGMSYAITGESAALMGIPGYRRLRDDDDDVLVDFFSGYDTGHHQQQAVATRFLRTIFEGTQPSDVRRFHGTAGRQWADVRPGQTVDLPLTATARSRDTVTYALRDQDRDNPTDPQYLIVFPKGTATAGISHEWDENGDYRLPSWDEAVVAGRFRVKSRRVVDTPGSFGEYTRIELEPAEVYDPVRRRWVPPRRRPRPGHDFGELQGLVDELRDGGAQVHDDGTVSVWRINNPNRHRDRDVDEQYTTSRDIATVWRAPGTPEPVEERLPLAQVRLIEQYSDETRVAIPERPAASGAPAGPEKGPSWPDQLAAQLRAEFPGLMLDLHRDPSGYVILPRIKVPERQQGTGTAIMQRIVTAADANGDTLVLSPTTEWGSSLARLTRFYRRFGFVPNKGRAKDFTTRETMIRRPQT